jgi:hypothetical protein
MRGLFGIDSYGKSSNIRNPFAHRHIVIYETPPPLSSREWKRGTRGMGSEQPANAIRDEQNN